MNVRRVCIPMGGVREHVFAGVATFLRGQPCRTSADDARECGHQEPTRTLLGTVKAVYRRCRDTQLQEFTKMKTIPPSGPAETLHFATHQLTRDLM